MPWWSMVLKEAAAYILAAGTGSHVPSRSVALEQAAMCPHDQSYCNRQLCRVAISGAGTSSYVTCHMACVLRWSVVLVQASAQVRGSWRVAGGVTPKVWRRVVHHLLRLPVALSPGTTRVCRHRGDLGEAPLQHHLLLLDVCEEAVCFPEA